MYNERLSHMVLPWYRLWLRIQDESTTFGAARRFYGNRSRDPIMTDIFYTISDRLKETMNEK
jgi:hypothetical protein